MKSQQAKMSKEIITAQLEMCAKHKDWLRGKRLLDHVLAMDLGGLDDRVWYWCRKLCEQCERPEFLEELQQFLKSNNIDSSVLWTSPKKTKGLRKRLEGEEAAASSKFISGKQPLGKYQRTTRASTIILKIKKTSTQPLQLNGPYDKNLHLFETSHDTPIESITRLLRSSDPSSIPQVSGHQKDLWQRVIHSRRAFLHRRRGKRNLDNDDGENDYVKLATEGLYTSKHERRKGWHRAELMSYSNNSLDDSGCSADVHIDNISNKRTKS